MIGSLAPRVVVTLLDQKEESKVVTEGNLSNPVFDASFALVLPPDPTAPIKIELFSHSESLGSYQIPLDQLRLGETKDEWQQLDSDSKPETPPQLHITTTVTIEGVGSEAGEAVLNALMVAEGFSVIWRLGKIEIQDTVRAVCRELLDKNSVPKDVRKKRAMALKELGEIYNRVSKTFIPPDVEDEEAEAGDHRQLPQQAEKEKP